MLESVSRQVKRTLQSEGREDRESTGLTPEDKIERKLAASTRELLSSMCAAMGWGREMDHGTGSNVETKRTSNATYRARSWAWNSDNALHRGFYAYETLRTR